MIDAAGAPPGIRCPSEPARALLVVRAQLGGPFERLSLGGETSRVPSLPRDVLEGLGDLVVGSFRRRGQVPCTACSLGHARECAVRFPTVCGRGRTVDGRAHERMAKLDPCPARDEGGALELVEGVDRDPGAIEERRLCISCRREQQKRSPGVLAEPIGPGRERLLNERPGSDRRRWRRVADSLLLGHQRRKLEQPERVSGADLQEPVGDPAVELVRKRALEQLARRSDREPLEPQLRKRPLLREQARLALADAGEKGDGLVLDPSADEAEHLLRAEVCPLCVVDTHDDGPPVGCHREERQDRRTDGERARLQRRPQLEDAAQQSGRALVESADFMAQRPEQRLQGRVADGAFGLDTRRLENLPAL